MHSEQQRLEVFFAQTENVQELERAWGQINRQLNALLLAKNNHAVHVNTKMLALIYCALAEAHFSKILHTPKGLKLSEIREVKAAIKAGSVKNGWVKCVDLAVRSVSGVGSHGAVVRKQLQSLINKFIFDPSLLRNKLAHGQWSIALNRDTDAVNPQLTSDLADLDVIELYRRKFALRRLAQIVEDIIESPNKAHQRDYSAHLDAFVSDQQATAAWTLEGKIEQLRKKKSRHHFVSGT